MQILPIKTRKLQPPQDDLFAALDESLPELMDGDILFITSKVASIHQGKCVPTSEVQDKDSIIREEADAVLESECQRGILIGIKHNMINPFAGVDESNADGHYILLPEEPNKFAQEVRKYLTQKFNLTVAGVVIVDSAFLPLRSGSVGISIGHAGFAPLRSYDGKQDIFGRDLEMSKINIVDSLSGVAGIYFGEGDEQTPLVLMRGIEGVEFIDKDKSAELTDLPFGDSFCAFLNMFKKKTSS